MLNQRFEALDGFRGLCAIFVVIFHIPTISYIKNADIFYTITNNSQILIEFFFVLSGFVIAHGYGYRENLSASLFIKSRFFRIYPLHFIMFSVLFSFELAKFIVYKFGYLTFTHTPLEGQNGLNEIIPNLLLIQSWLPMADSFSFNYPSWSVSIEFYSYLIFIFLTILFNRLKTISWLCLYLVSTYLLITDNAIIKPEALSGLSCFFGGSFIYHLYKSLYNTVISQKIKDSKYILSVLEANILILIIISALTEFIPHKQFFTKILFFVAIFIFAFESGYISTVLRKHLFQILGKLSYSIYMTHIFIIYLFFSTVVMLQKLTSLEMSIFIDGKRYIDLGSYIANDVVIVILIAIVIAISMLSYQYIEVKGQQLGKKLKFQL